MERKKKKERVELKWKKVRGALSTLIINGKNKDVKLNDTFSATEDEVPRAFRDQFECLDKKVKAPKTTPANPPVFKLKEIRKNGPDKGKFNVVNGSGKKQNTDPLEKEDAEKLIEELKKGKE